MELIIYMQIIKEIKYLDIWRRQATGTVSEIFGEEELERDIGTRLFMFRGDLDEGFEIKYTRS